MQRYVNIVEYFFAANMEVVDQHVPIVINVYPKINIYFLKKKHMKNNNGLLLTNA